MAGPANREDIFRVSVVGFEPGCQMLIDSIENPDGVVSIAFVSKVSNYTLCSNRCCSKN